MLLSLCRHCHLVPLSPAVQPVEDESDCKYSSAPADGQCDFEYNFMFIIFPPAEECMQS
jgi:hypothetical protein